MRPGGAGNFTDFQDLLENWRAPWLNSTYRTQAIRDQKEAAGPVAQEDKGGAAMLHIGESKTTTCQGISRRSILQAGGLGALGLTLVDWWRVTEAVASPATSAGGREVSCIFVFLSGGPSHLET